MTMSEFFFSLWRREGRRSCLGISPRLAWTPTLPRHGLRQQGADAVSALLHPNPCLLPQSASLNTFLSGHFISTSIAVQILVTVMVLCICTSAQCKFVNTFVLYFFKKRFCLVWNVEMSLLQIPDIACLSLKANCTWKSLAICIKI